MTNQENYLTIEKFQKIISDGISLEGVGVVGADGVVQGLSMDAVAAANGISEKHLQHIYDFIRCERGSMEALQAFEVIKADIDQHIPKGFTDQEKAQAWKDLTGRVSSTVGQLEAAWKDAAAARDSQIKKKAQISDLIQNISKKYDESQKRLSDIESEIKENQNSDSEKLKQLYIDQEYQKQLSQFLDKELKQYNSLYFDLSEDLNRTEIELQEAARKYEAAALVQSLPETAERAEKNAPHLEANIDIGNELTSQARDLEEAYKQAGTVFTRMGFDIKSRVINLAEDFAHVVDQRVNEHNISKAIRNTKPSLSETLTVSWHTFRAKQSIKRMNRLEAKIHKAEDRTARMMMRQAKRAFYHDQRENADIYRQEALAQGQTYEKKKFDAAAYQKSPEFLKALEATRQDLKAQREIEFYGLKGHISKVSEAAQARKEKYQQFNEQIKEMKDIGDLRSTVDFSQDLRSIIQERNKDLDSMYAHGSKTVRSAFQEADYEESFTIER